MKIKHSVFDAPRFQAMQQHPYFASAMAGMGRPMIFLDLPGHGKAQVFSRRIWPVHKQFRMVSRGPVWDDLPSEALQHEAVSVLRNNKVRVINAEDIQPHILKAAGYRQIMTPSYVGVLTLGHGPDVRRNLMSIKWRNALRKAEALNLRVEMRDYHHSIDKWILDEDAKQQTSNGYRAMPGAVTQAFAIMNKGQARVVTVAKHAIPIAVMIFLRHGTVATYHIGWSSPEGRACNAHNLCLAHAADQLEAEGTMVIDMGSIDTVAAPGLARFKIGVGAQIKQLGGTWLHLWCFGRQRHL